MALDQAQGLVTEPDVPISGTALVNDAPHHLDCRVSLARAISPDFVAQHHGSPWN